ncbi:MAG: 1-deoxy-D-xylulose-5-phosphate synthase [Desulfobacteraceae bacterium 4572_88]|nr:MAG: 1-deoxy-D-xylulose-5-phosphate synthase [Desulfobacteraceae bacterium 4572_88]
MSLLEKIDSPADLKELSQSELPAVAAEIRKMIVDVVSENGGHLAPSLGVVELTVALHYVFDTPRDKIIWDVGHQSYAHKILTGRGKQFSSLRKHGGICGFTRISESPHDAFSTGHSSTSISAGIGIAAARCLKKEKGKVVAVIGDGSLTAGLAYEGLNQAGDLQKDLIVILNDNDMSIAPNVGALSSLLSRTFSSGKMQNLRKKVGDFLKSLPGIGVDVYQFAKRSEESFMTFITPGVLFEAFDFEYFGPIDGHNLTHLINILNNISLLKEPVLLHVITTKGKGYLPAEKNPVHFHGVGCFDVETGVCPGNNSSVPSYTSVFGETLVKLARENEKIIAVTAAMPEGTGLRKFAETYPDRFFDVGIAEQHGVTFAAGMATEGFRPVVAIYSTFLQRAYDQILHDVCLESLPVVFALDRGGIVGEDGPTHQGLFDLSYLRSLPNMVLMAPKDENELRRMLVTALAYDGPIAFRYPRGIGTGVEMEEDIRALPMGKGEILRQGPDVLILAIGRSVCDALEAHSELAKEGVAATVVNCRFVKPMDTELICSLAEKIPRIITAEENVCQGGFGSAVLECLCQEDIRNFRMKRVGVADIFVEHGTQDYLRGKYGVDATAIAEAARQLMKSDV